MLPERLSRIIELFARLPGVGEKTAMRYAMFLITADESIAKELGGTLCMMHSMIRPCERCGHIADVHEGEAVLCSICKDSRRDSSLLCVVSRVQDLLAIERSRCMRGRYMVLGKLLQPLEGVNPEDLPIGKLRDRVREEGVQELLLATPPSVDGEATALFIAQELSDMGIRLTRLASGIPHGGDLEFADQITLGRAFEGRRALGKQPVLMEAGESWQS